MYVCFDMFVGLSAIKFQIGPTTENLKLKVCAKKALWEEKTNLGKNIKNTFIGNMKTPLEHYLIHNTSS